ncbi:MAG: beta-ketoacyl-[acyl-carrier-protein] synthase family protein [Planctomycetes bacterium]|nr:beta-ketoacyl-[acyl-carrier-protein] synthase family protein [Planctomycetota bacterium]MBI3835551.1 beta-ketoacyl-[acyl-carrier-protein] synthase family protein [Planctomycetota bacterium]
MPSRRRVVITGLGVATPIGIGIDAFWEALLNGRSGIRRIATFDPSGFPTQIAGELPPFKLEDCVPKSYRKSAKVMARDIVIAAACAYHAVRDAGLNTKCIIDRGEATGPPNVDSTRFGANIGAGLICADLNELASALSTAADDNGAFSLRRWGAEGMTNLTPLWLLKFLPNMLACHVTIVHDAQAPSNTITCGEASSHLAIGEAYRTVARGDADVCICGGAESKANPMALARPQLLKRLNTSDNAAPERASRPFARDRAGMVSSEGGGLVILEALEHAQARGAKIYAELVGFGASCNTKSWSSPELTGNGIATSLKKAIADAKLSSDKIELIAPFGVGTEAHDSSEMAAWNSVLGSHLSNIPAICTRGALGNNGAGTGAIDFAALVTSLHRGTIPPSINTSQLDPACRFQFVQNDPRDSRASVGISVAWALGGGQCAALVVRKFTN